MENSKKDMAQDKAMVKKAFSMHDAQEHKGEHTNLSKLKKGGKMVKKFAEGGITKEMPTSKAMGNMGMAKGGKVKKFPVGGLAVAPGMRPGMTKPGGASMQNIKYRQYMNQAGQGAGPGAESYNSPRPLLGGTPNTGPMTQQGSMDMASRPTPGAIPPPAPSLSGMTPAPAGATGMSAMAPTYKKGGKIMAKKACSGGKMASGGSFRTSANGVASKGKTKGTQVKMYAKGGSVSPDGVAQRGKTRAPGFR